MKYIRHLKSFSCFYCYFLIIGYIKKEEHLKKKYMTIFSYVFTTLSKKKKKIKK